VKAGVSGLFVETKDTSLFPIGGKARKHSNLTLAGKVVVHDPVEIRSRR